jgi:hypothetical protein
MSAKTFLLMVGPNVRMPVLSIKVIEGKDKPFTDDKQSQRRLALAQQIGNRRKLAVPQA